MLPLPASLLCLLPSVPALQDPPPAPQRLAWGDLDADGLPDLVAVRDGALRLFAQRADGSLVDVTASAGLAALADVRVAAWHDLDGDGALDLALGTGAGLRLLVGDGRGAFRDATAASGLELPQGAVTSLAFADFDRDGRSDLAATVAGSDELARNLGAGRFERVDLGWPERSAPIGRTPSTDESAPGAGSVAATAGAGLGGAASTGQRAAAAALGICAATLADSVLGGCLSASAVPALGSLMPLSIDFNVDLAGNVGMGTDTPGAKLDVVGDVRASGQLVSTAPGGAPLVVGSSALVTNLNADRLDGLDAADFTQLGASIEGSEITDASITGADLAPDSVDTSKVAPASLALDDLGASGALAGEVPTWSGGAWIPAPPPNPQYMAGAGLELAAGTFSVATGGVDGAMLADGAIGDAAVSPTAAIAGTKVDPDFGSQALVSTGTLSVRGLRTLAGSSSPSVVGGHPDNALGAAVSGATIAGGGQAGTSRNLVSGNHGTIGGGFKNEAAAHATVAGGEDNRATGSGSSIGGGDHNFASGVAASVGGGGDNLASGFAASIAGGSFNTASGLGSGVLGGTSNTAGGDYSMVLGGSLNAASGHHSLAAGTTARAQHPGAFVWADSTGGFFSSSGDDQFLVRAAGGMGLNTTAPEGALHVLDGSAGAVTANVNSIAVFERDTGGFVSILGPDGSSKGLLFGRASDPNSGGIVYDQASVSNESMQFRTGGNSTRMTITAAGDVGIGTSSPAFTLHVNGTAGKPGGGSWSVASDARLKRDVEPLEAALERLLALRGVTYEYVDPAAIGELADTQTGFLAQEVEQVFPEWVEEAPDGYKRLSIRGFEALAVEALRELREEHERQLGALGEEVAGLRARLGEMEAALSAASQLQPR